MAARSKTRAKNRATARPKATGRSRPARAGSAGRRSSTRPQRRGRAQPSRSARKLGAMTVAQMVPAEALALLELDHREVEAFFDQFEQSDDVGEKEKLAAKICRALTVHAEIEEKIFYPAVRKATGEDDILDEAAVEHASAKQLIAEIEAMRPRDRLFAAKVKVLGEYVKHHIHEEENELFPKARESDLDLYEIGARLAETKVNLLREHAR